MLANSAETRKTRSRGETREKAHTSQQYLTVRVRGGDDVDGSHEHTMEAPPKKTFKKAPLVSNALAACLLQKRRRTARSSAVPKNPSLGPANAVTGVRPERPRALCAAPWARGVGPAQSPVPRGDPAGACCWLRACAAPQGQSRLSHSDLGGAAHRGGRGGAGGDLVCH